MKILLLLLFVSCSTVTVEPLEDDSFKPHLERFEQLYGHKVVGVDITIGVIRDAVGREMLNPTAFCRMSNPREIVFNVHRWYVLPYMYREMIVFHELGHCVLGRGHPDLDNDYRPLFLDETECPSSIMHSGLTNNRMTTGCYLEFYDYYIHELFSPVLIRKDLSGTNK